VWIDLKFHFGNHKSSLYCSRTLAGIELHTISAKSLCHKGFERLPVAYLPRVSFAKKSVILLLKGFRAFPEKYFLIKKFC
jgi:hypothetical protein